ncbi:MAG: hypothetical protein IJF78_05085 [Clostridia bacterium]|nr:hypothetical protein [Clostridia bacterium]
MLLILQYAALICAFFLPFAIGWTVQSARAHDRRRLVIAAVLLAVSLGVIGITVWLAFGISSVS